MRFRRALAVVAAGGGIAALAGCNPAPGEGHITLSGYEQAEVSGPAVRCPGPWEEGETVSNWTWEGVIDGVPARVAFVGFFGEEVDTAVVQFGDYDNPNGPGPRSYSAWSRATPPSGSVTHLGVDEDRTLHATASMPVPNGPPGATVEVEVALRCPD